MIFFSFLEEHTGDGGTGSIVDRAGAAGNPVSMLIMV